MTFTAVIAFLFVLFFVSGCKEQDPLRKGRIQIEYWELWTGFEYQAMKDLVDKFNRSQDEIYVKMLSISQIDRKILISTAGGVPPDIAGLMPGFIPQFADKNALEPLDPLMDIIGVKKEDYIDIYWQLGNYNGIQYALPSTPAVLALHYNKDILRSVGLDPENPPQTIEELDAMAEKMMVKRDELNYDRLGFIQTSPGWWNYAWVYFFGGKWFDGENITANCPENIRAFEWIESYAKKYGSRQLQNFTGGFTSPNFDSAENPFFAERLGMVFQGVWLSNFIDKYNPDMDWAITSFPSEGGRLKDSVMAECNLLVIPKGAKHRIEAAKFLGFIQKPENLQYLALKHTKFIPLKLANDIDYTDHPNPHIKEFVRLAQSENIFSVPWIPIWTEMDAEISNALQAVWLQKMTAREALDHAQERLEDKWDEYKRIKKAIEKQ